MSIAVRTLMLRMGIEALALQPATSKAAPGNKINCRRGLITCEQNSALWGNRLVLVGANSAYPARTSAAPFSPIISDAALVFAAVTMGITDASITLSRSTPRTRNSGSTTDVGSLPIRQVPT